MCPAAIAEPLGQPRCGLSYVLREVIPAKSGVVLLAIIGAGVKVAVVRPMPCWLIASRIK
jgi:hypothetical protein